jgi:hypothetical protein
MDHSEETRFKPCVPVAPTFSKDDIVETTSIQCALCVSRHASTAAISGVYLILVRRKVAQQTRTKVLKISTLSDWGYENITCFNGAEFLQLLLTPPLPTRHDKRMRKMLVERSPCRGNTYVSQAFEAINNFIEVLS